MSALWSREEFARLMRRVQDIRGAPFIESRGFAQNYPDHFIIHYHQDFNSYKKSNPTTTLTQKEFDQYFQTGYATEKILTLESVRILREFPKLQRVEIHVPPFGVYISVLVSRDDVPNVVVPDPLDNLHDIGWRQFVDHVGYDRQMRRAFLKIFGETRGAFY